MRLNVYKGFPEGYDAMGALNAAVEGSGLDHRLLELVKLRCSQLNGCAYCLDMHWKDAKVLGEADHRLYSLPAWRETGFYTEAERAALDLAESITLVATSRVPDDVLDRARDHFDDEQLSRLVFAVVTINAWNRLSIASGAEAGRYQPGRRGERSTASARPSGGF
jgi:AhpD family alkylhydroperoxidase